MHTCVNIGSWKQWQGILKDGKSDPDRVNGKFDCKHEFIKSLATSPRYIEEDFACHHNLLTTLKGGPDVVGGSYRCSNNKIETLVGGPSLVRNMFSCNNNKLTSLEGVPAARCYGFSNNQLTNLKDIHKIILETSSLWLDKNPIKSNILGLLLIKGLNNVIADGPAFVILNRHLKGDRDILECQEELIDAGFKEFARL